MRILVTGGFGYLGLALLRGLAGHDLVALGRSPRNPAARAAIPPGVTVTEGDVAGQSAALLRQTGPFDAIVHLAGGGGPHKVERDPVAATRDNLEATLELLEAARAGGVPRLLYASTIAVYGTHRVPLGPYREEDTPAPDDFYGALKYAAERAWTSPQLGQGCALRLANIYGAGAGVDMGVNGAVERFARAAASGGTITLFGTGTQTIDYVHVDDVVTAFRLALTHPGPLPPALNIGSGAPISIATLAQTCLRLGTQSHHPPNLVRKEDPGGKIWPDRSLAIGKAAAVLSWRPTVPLETGLQGLIHMMSNNPAVTPSRAHP